MKSQSELREQLISLGFQGKSLRELESLILNENDFESFQNFIILNEGELKSRLHTVYKYKLYLKENSTYNFELFVSDYALSISKEERRIALEKLVKQHVSMQMLDKIELYIEMKTLTWEQFYTIFKEHEMKYSLETILNLVESSKKNIAIMFKKIASLSAKTLVFSVSAKVIYGVAVPIALLA